MKKPDNVRQEVWEAMAEMLNMHGETLWRLRDK